MLNSFFRKHRSYTPFFPLLFITMAAQGSQYATPVEDFFNAVREGSNSVYTLVQRYRYLVNARNNNNETALHTIARNGDRFRVHTYIRNAQGNMIRIPLGDAADTIADFLLKNGAEVNATNQNRLTPLQIAMLEGHTAVADTLIRHRANVNVTFDTGETLLHWTIKYHRLSYVQMLIRAGAQTNAQNNDSETPLHYAARYGRSAELIHSLIAYGRAQVDAINRSGNTPLHIAAGCAHYSGARTLIRHHANVNARNHRSKTPLHYVVSHDEMDSSAKANRKNIVEALANAGADVNATTREGRTPLHFVARASYAKRLLRHGANPSLQDRNGLSPYYAALMHGKLKLALVLLEAHPELDTPETRQCSEEFRRRCTTLDVIRFYRARRHQSRRLSGTIEPHDHTAIQAEAGTEMIRFLNNNSIYSLTHLPRVLNTMIVSYLISPEAAEELQLNPTRLQSMRAWLRRHMP